MIIIDGNNADYFGPTGTGVTCTTCPVPSTRPPNESLLGATIGDLFLAPL